MRKNAKSSYEYEKHYVYQRDPIQILFQVEIFSRACYISFRMIYNTYAICKVFKIYETYT